MKLEWASLVSKSVILIWQHQIGTRGATRMKSKSKKPIKKKKLSQGNGSPDLGDHPPSQLAEDWHKRIEVKYEEVKWEDSFDDFEDMVSSVVRRKEIHGLDTSMESIVAAAESLWAKARKRREKISSQPILPKGWDSAVADYGSLMDRLSEEEKKGIKYSTEWKMYPSTPPDGSFVGTDGTADQVQTWVFNNKTQKYEHRHGVDLSKQIEDYYADKKPQAADAIPDSTPKPYCNREYPVIDDFLEFREILIRRAYEVTKSADLTAEVSSQFCFPLFQEYLKDRRK